jgi:hypothetical protein
MPATSEAQRRAAGAALAIKRGEAPKQKARGAVKSMLSMSEAELRDYAKKPKKGQA